VFWGHTKRTDSDPNPPLALYGVRPPVRRVSDSAYDRGLSSPPLAQCGVKSAMKNLRFGSGLSMSSQNLLKPYCGLEQNNAASGIRVSLPGEVQLLTGGIGLLRKIRLRRQLSLRDVEEQSLRLCTGMGQ
jgi:hypothetical protein